MSAGNRRTSIVHKVLAFESRRPDVWIWLPGQSITGQYEALTSDDELVQDTNGRRFLRALSQKVNGTKEVGK